MKSNIKFRHRSCVMLLFKNNIIFSMPHDWSYKKEIVLLNPLFEMIWYASICYFFMIVYVKHGSRILYFAVKGMRNSLNLKYIYTACRDYMQYIYCWISQILKVENFTKGYMISRVTLYKYTVIWYQV